MKLENATLEPTIAPVWANAACAATRDGVGPHARAMSLLAAEGLDACEGEGAESLSKSASGIDAKLFGRDDVVKVPVVDAF